MEKFKNLTNIQFLFLSTVILLPILLTLGIAIAEIVLFFFTFYGIYKTLKEKKFYLIKNKEIIFLFIFSIYIAINSILNNVNVDKSSSIFFFRHVLLVISIIYIFEKCYKEHQKVTKFLYLFFIIIFIDSLIQFFLGKNILGYETINNRVSSFFGDDLILGSFLILFFPITLIFFLDKKELLFKDIFFGFYFFTILLSGERRAFVILLLSVLFIIIFSKEIRKLIFKSLIIFISLVIINLFIFKGTYDPLNRIFVKTYNETIKYNEKNKINDDPILENKKKIIIFSYEHTNHYRLAIHLIKQKPIFGHGPKGFREYCRGVNYDSEFGMCTTHPHHLLLQIIVELGIVGLIFYLFAALYVIKNFINLFKFNNKSNISVILMTLVLINIFIPLVPSGNFFNNKNLMLCFYSIGLYLYFYRFNVRS
mgnify:FL=1